MVHASLFSGIGGPEVAAAMLGWHNAFHCEINDFCRKILEYWFPNSKSYENIIETDFTEWRGKVDVLTGGFPCQPFSYAGQRKGHEDDRYLWPQMLRAITEIRPNWVIGENVAGITTMAEQGKISEVGCEESLFGEGDGLYHYRQRQIFTIERVCRDLEGAGYSVQLVIIPACAVGAPHRRDRIFIIAQNTMSSGQLHGCNEKQGSERYGCCESSSDTTGAGLQYGHQPRGENSQTGEIQGERCGAIKHIYVETDGNRRLITDTEEQQSERMRYEQSENCGEKQEQLGGSGGKDGGVRYVTDTDCNGLYGGNGSNQEGYRQTAFGFSETHDGNFDDSVRREWKTEQVCGSRWRDFPTVSPVHRGNDGLPFDVDSLSIPFAKWRTESLKAYGNAIVPQVMYEIFLAIERIEKRDF